MPHQIQSASTKACDKCRGRKTRCIPSEEDDRKCKGCYNLDIECVRTHQPKRPGPRTAREKNLSLARSARASSSRSSPNTSRHCRPGEASVRCSQSSTSTQGDLQTREDFSSPVGGGGCAFPAFDNVNRLVVPDAPISENNASARGLNIDLDPGMAPPLVMATAEVCGSGSEVAVDPQIRSILGFNADPAIRDVMDYTRADQAGLDFEVYAATYQTSSMGGPSQHKTCALSSLISPSYNQTSWPDTGRILPQIETVLRWHVVIFFLSLYLKHQHHLMPLVHKPTFAQDVLARKDRDDEVFRALLFSLVAYVICQLPKSEMIGEFTEAELETFAATSYKASRTIISKYLRRPTLTLLVSMTANHYYCKTSQRLEMSRITLAEAIALAHALRVDGALSADNQDVVSRELSRRAYWHLFNMDKTEAVGGEGMLLTDIDQLPPYPLEIDDEYITSQGNFPQPEGSPSYMTGFVLNTRLFNTLSECLFRHRNLDFMLRAGVSRNILGEWAKQQQGVLRRTLETIPYAWTKPGIEYSRHGDLYATQRANIIVTAVTLELALIDLGTVLEAGFDFEEEKQSLTKTAYDLLSKQVCPALPWLTRC